MIYDSLSNCEKYYSLCEKFKQAFDFLKNTNLKELEDGSYEISGREIYANVQTLVTKPIEEKKWEAHRKYIDIQYVISGHEKMGFGILGDFKKTIVEYDPKKDIEFLDGEKYSFVTVEEGNFVVFYPDDVHAPMLNYKESEKIKKVIVKIAQTR